MKLQGVSISSLAFPHGPLRRASCSRSSSRLHASSTSACFFAFAFESLSLSQTNQMQMPQGNAQGNVQVPFSTREPATAKLPVQMHARESASVCAASPLHSRTGTAAPHVLLALLSPPSRKLNLGMLLCFRIRISVCTPSSDSFLLEVLLNCSCV